MSLQKQPVAINFAQGIDTKSDPWQIPIGKFFNLINSVFTKAGRLTKRNGFGQLPSPTIAPTFITTLQDSLLAIGDGVQALTPINTWANLVPRPNVQLSVQTLARGPYTSTFSDSVTASNGITCAIYNTIFISNTDTITMNVCLASLVDARTGQNVSDTKEVLAAPIDPKQPALSTYPRVFDLGTNFVICYTKIGGGEIDFITIDKTTFVTSAPVTLTTSGSASNVSIFDGVVFNNVLYLAYQDSANGVSLITLTSGLVIGTPVQLDAAHSPIAISVTPDATNGDVWVSYIDTTTNGDIWSTAVSTPSLTQIVAPTKMFVTGVGPPPTSITANITSLATVGVNRVYVTFPGTYPSNAGFADIKMNTITSLGVVGTESFLVKSLGLASKAFFIGTDQYVLGQYYSNAQSTLFLLRLPRVFPDVEPRNVVSRLAYSNAFNAPLFGLPSSTVLNGSAYISYLLADYAQPINPSIVPGTTILFNYGTNQVKYNFTNLIDSSIELSNNLSLTGGFLWNYDGLAAVENNFLLFPDNVALDSTTPFGSMDAGEYQYQVIYTWVDNKGNLIRSAPSVPVTVDLLSPGAVVLDIPTIRVTYKGGVGIEIYRASTVQPIFYRVNIGYVENNPNNTQPEYIQYTDVLNDAQIVGDEILYTTGGVVEDTGAPSTSIMTLWDTRLWIVNAEDTNQLWFSKTAIEGTPIEMSELLTFFVGQDLGSQGATNGVSALASMDDKLIVFTPNSIRYINGQGPDNTGANSSYSQPIHITSTAGCIAHSSIALIPIGLLFQSDKGIWLLGRDLNTKYIGAPVENYTEVSVVVSALVIPDSTQVRFMLADGTILMYDYFYDQWGSFTGVTAASSTLFKGLHTFIDQSSNIFQETPGVYADGTNSVNMFFQTGWINLVGLQAYERAYYFYLLGQYATPHTLNVQIGYDYETTIEQVSNITPVQVAPPPVNTSNVEQWRVFLQRGKCQAFQLTITENDQSVGAGLTLSGINMVIGKKKGYPVRRQNLSVG